MTVLMLYRDNACSAKKQMVGRVGKRRNWTEKDHGSERKEATTDSWASQVLFGMERSEV